MAQSIKLLTVVTLLFGQVTFPIKSAVSAEKPDEPRKSEFNTIATIWSDQEYAITPTKSFEVSATFDVTTRPDIFKNIRSFYGEYNTAKLNNGAVVKWSFSNNNSGSGGSYIYKLDRVILAESMKELGFKYDIDPQEKIPSFGSNRPCNLSASARLKIPFHGFPFIAACKKNKGDGGSAIVLYDGTGRYRKIGEYPLLIIHMSLGSPLHSARPVLFILAQSNDSPQIVIQQYSLR